MRAPDTLVSALVVIFATVQAGWAMLFFGGYFVAWLVAAPQDTQLVVFMGQYEFAAFFLVSVAMAIIMTVLVGVVAWISNSKSAKDRGRVERLIDAWVDKLGRSSR